MKSTIIRIIVVVSIIYSIGLIFIFFTEFVMEKKILDINNSYTSVSIRMPDNGNYINLMIEVAPKNVLEGNITIKENNSVVYRGFLGKKYTSVNSHSAFYLLLPEDKQNNTLLKAKKTYVFDIQLKNIFHPTILKMSWLELGWYTLFDDKIEIELLKEKEI